MNASKVFWHATYTKSSTILITRTHISCTDDQSSLWNWAEEIPKTCLKFQTTVLHSTKKFDVPNTNKKTSMNKQWH